MAEWRNGEMADGMAEWQKEWQNSNGGNGYIRTIYGTHRRHRGHRRRHLLIFYSIDVEDSRLNINAECL